MVCMLLIILMSTWGLTAQEEIMPHGEPYFVPEEYLQPFSLPESLSYDGDAATRSLPSQQLLDHGEPWFLDSRYDNLFTPFYAGDGTYIPFPIVRPQPTSISTAEDLYRYLAQPTDLKPSLTILLAQEELKAQSYTETIKNQKALFMDYANTSMSNQELQNIIDHIPLKAVEGITKHEIADSITRQFFDRNNNLPSDLPTNYTCFSQLDSLVLTLDALYKNTQDSENPPVSHEEYENYSKAFMRGFGAPDIENFVLDVTQTPASNGGMLRRLWSARQSNTYTFLKSHSCDQLKGNLFNLGITDFIAQGFRDFIDSRTQRDQKKENSA